MTADIVTKQTRVGQKLEERMNQLKLSIRDVAIGVGATYEGIRKVIRGNSVPSQFMLKSIAEYLDMDFTALQQIAVADRIEVKYGNMPREISGKVPELEPIERAWPDLTPEQQSDAIAMITGWAKRNRRGR